MKQFVRLILVSFAFLSFLSCDFVPEHRRFENFRLPLPTQEEVALVDGKALSLNDFISIREILHQPSSEAALWVGTAVIVLTHQSQKRGTDLPIRSALEIARYALRDISQKEVLSSLQKLYPSAQSPPSPDEVRKEIDQLLHTAVIQKNPTALSRFH